MSRKRKKAQTTQDAKMPPGFTTDAFSNVMARLGYNTPNLMEGTTYPLTRLTQDYQLMNSLYRGHWIVRKIIDTIPQDMTRNWIKITTQLPPDEIRKVDKLWRVRNVKAKILEGLKWGRLYGGAVGVILIEGHEDILDQKLDFDMIMPGTFKGVMIIDRWSGAYPSGEMVSDINDPEFGLPESYSVTLEGTNALDVHHSRIIRFIGRELPHWEKIAELQWGESEIEVIFDELKKRDNTSWNIAQLIFLANLRVLKMGDLGQMLSVGNEKVKADVYNTVQSQNWLMSNMGIHLLDKEDSFETHQYSFGGLNDIYESFMLDMSGASEIPVTKLFGRSPAGMNATGEGDLENYHEVIQQAQESTLAPIIDKLLPIMFMSELGAIPEDLDYLFNPIRTPNDKDMAELTDKKTTSINTVYVSGLITQKTAMKELKQLGETTGMFTNITDEDIEAANDVTDPGETLPGGDLGYGGLLGTEETNGAEIPKKNPTSDGKARGIISWLRRSNRDT